MQIRLARAAFAIAAVLAAPEARAQDAERQRTVAGVEAVEDHWTSAFIGGDQAYLERLLDPAYISVGRTGRPRPKAEIIALSKKIAAMPRQAYEKPARHVDIRGDAAIVTVSGAQDTSLDLFFWRAGAWHAWYSQHTPTAAPNTPAG